MIKDLIKAFKNYDAWIYLAWFDIKTRYRRTVLGPIWMVIVTMISIGCMGVLSSILFKADIATFLPYVACGIISWNYLTIIINESCNLYIVNAYSIQNIKTNLITLCLRMFVRNTLVFLHSLALVFLILVITNGFNVKHFLLIPALIIIAINALCIGITFGFFSARFRDIVQIIQTILTIMIFITPIMWKKEMLNDHQIIALLNPFTHFIAIIREPLLGNVPSIDNFSAILIITITNVIIASHCYNRFKHRLVFWL